LQVERASVDGDAEQAVKNIDWNCLKLLCCFCVIADAVGASLVKAYVCSIIWTSVLIFIIQDWYLLLRLPCCCCVVADAVGASLVKK
jgi:uncharacterized membrane protein YfcA